MLHEKVKFIEDFSLDRRLYWKISDLYGRCEWEIIWHKNNLATPWQAKKAGAKNWLPINGKKLVEELTRRTIDIAEFERQLTGNILTQVVFYNNAINEAKKMLGDSKIESAISQHESFAKELLTAIRELTENNNSDKSKVKNTESSDHQPSSQKPRPIPTIELNPDRREKPRIEASKKDKDAATLLRLIKNSK